MHDEPEYFSRRRFLQWSAAGVAAASAPVLLPRASAQTPESQAKRQPPAQAITLHSPELHVTLDAGSGLPYEYRLLKNHSRLRGEDAGAAIEVTLCRKDPWSFATVVVTPHSYKA